MINVNDKKTWPDLIEPNYENALAAFKILARHHSLYMSSSEDLDIDEIDDVQLENIIKDNTTEFFFNLNDTLYYACSDGELVPTPMTIEDVGFEQADKTYREILQIYNLSKNFGWIGFLAWVCQKRGHLPYVDEVRQELLSEVGCVELYALEFEEL
jgi:hypothetical protein